MKARLVILSLLPALLTGCDLLLVSATSPGLLPGYGRPLTGRVLDSRTGMPIGKASVGAGWTFTTTDNEGRFSLYGDFSGGKQVSVSRAGYVAMTQESPQTQEGQDFFLSPLFPQATTVSSRRLSLVARLMCRVEDGNYPITAYGNISFAGRNQVTNAVTGQCTLETTEALPGQVYSGLLAGGVIEGGPVGDSSDPQTAQFSYKYFGYRLIDLPTTDTASTATASADLRLQNVDIKDLSLAYKGIAAYGTVTPLTRVFLDFGMLGSVLVARGSSTGQSLRVPSVNGAAYVVQAEIQGTGGRGGEVTEVSNLGGVVSVQFLAPPTVREPQDRSWGVGLTPTFAWEPVPDAQYYRVVVTEDQGGAAAQQKWVGTTTQNQLRYPGFWESDYNGGFLYQGATYSWTVEAFADRKATYKAAGDALPVLPYRRRFLSSHTGGMRFTR